LDGRPEYLVKWENVPSTENTWEPLDSFLDKRPVVFYHRYTQPAVRARNLQHLTLKIQRAVKECSDILKANPKAYHTEPLVDTVVTSRAVKLSSSILPAESEETKFVLLSELDEEQVKEILLIYDHSEVPVERLISPIDHEKVGLSLSVNLMSEPFSMPSAESSTSKGLASERSTERSKGPSLVSLEDAASIDRSQASVPMSMLHPARAALMATRDSESSKRGRHLVEQSDIEATMEIDLEYDSGALPTLGARPSARKRRRFSCFRINRS